MSTDSRIRATAADGFVFAVAVSTTDAARTAQQIHQAWPVAAAALGRLMSCAAMLAANLKDADSRLTLEVVGNGPLGRLVAEIRSRDRLRARVQHPAVDLGVRADGKWPVGQAVGNLGEFRVLRQDGEGAWYQSQVPLATGEIGEDFLQYLVQSEQVASAVSVGVLVGRDGLVAGSGGVLVQALPGCPPGVIDAVAEDFGHLNQISRRLAEGEPLSSLLASVLPEPIHFYEVEPLAWACWCDRDNIAGILASLPEADRRELIQDGGAEVTCHFCRRAYRFSAEELARLGG